MQYKLQRFIHPFIFYSISNYTSNRAEECNVHLSLTATLVVLVGRRELKLLSKYYFAKITTPVMKSKQQNISDERGKVLTSIMSGDDCCFGK